MIRDITYNGKSLTDFGVFADFSEALNTSAYVVDSWTIPGRSGDLLSPEKRYENKMSIRLREWTKNGSLGGSMRSFRRVHEGG